MAPTCVSRSCDERRPVSSTAKPLRGKYPRQLTCVCGIFQCCTYTRVYCPPVAISSPAIRRNGRGEILLMLVGDLRESEGSNVMNSGGIAVLAGSAEKNSRCSSLIMKGMFLSEVEWGFT